MSLCLSVSVCLPACLSACLPVYLSVHLTCVSVCMFVCLPACLFVRLTVCMSVCPRSVCLFVSFCLSVCLYIDLSVCLSDYRSCCFVDANLECLATWRDGAQTYLVGRLLRPRDHLLSSDDDRYRCFVRFYIVHNLPRIKFVTCHNSIPQPSSPNSDISPTKLLTH